MKIIIVTTTIFLTLSVSAQWDTTEFVHHLGCLEEIEFTTINDGYIVANGLVGRSSDAGNTWSLDTSENGSFRIIDFINNDTVLVCCYPADGSDVMISYDAGGSWEFPPLSLNSEIDDAEFMPNGNVVIAVGSEFSFESTSEVVQNYYSNPVSEFVLSTVTIPPYDIDFVTDEIGFVCGRFLGSSVYKTLDGGLSWYTNDAMTGPVFEMTFPSSIIGYGLGDESRVWKTMDSGESWQMLTFDFGGFEVVDNFLMLDDIYFFNDTIGYMEVDMYDEDFNLTLDIYKTINGGDSWFQTEMEYGEFEGVNSIFCTSIDVCYAVGCDQVYKTTNGGGIDTGGLSNSNIDPRQLIVYPNPTNNYINVVSDAGLNFKVLYLVNLIGQKSEVDIVNITPSLITIDLTSLPSGIYYLRIDNEPNHMYKISKL